MQQPSGLTESPTAPQPMAKKPLDWAAAITGAAAKRPASIRAETFLKRRTTGSQPVDLYCNDGEKYVVKAHRNDAEQRRMIFNDQVIARLGALLGASVPYVALVDVPAELIAANADKLKGMGHMHPGVAHGSRRFNDVSERIDAIDHVNDDDNRHRFALLAVLHAWVGSYSDRQFLYDNSAPFRVYSVDHGHFFHGGPAWSVASLNSAPAAALSDDLVKTCKLSADELVDACSSLADISEQEIAEVLAVPPDDWGVSLDERVALAEYLHKRRAELLAAHPPKQKEGTSP